MRIVLKLIEIGFVESYLHLLDDKRNVCSIDFSGGCWDSLGSLGLRGTEVLHCFPESFGGLVVYRGIVCGAFHRFHSLEAGRILGVGGEHTFFELGHRDSGKGYGGLLEVIKISLSDGGVMADLHLVTL